MRRKEGGKEGRKVTKTKKEGEEGTTFRRI
jgi:hypothetical protein